MNDDKINQPENQQYSPKPIFETVPQEDQNERPQLLQPEEAPASLTPEEITSSSPPQDNQTPFSSGRKRYFYIAAGAVIFLIFFILIFRFFFGKTETNEEVHLVYWGLWEDKEVIAPLIDEYQQKNKNLKIEYQKMSPVDYREKIVARSQNQNVQRPDIFRFHNTWIPQIKEVVAPLPEEILSDREFETTFYPIHVKDLKIGEDYYGIPLAIDGLVLIYNDNLFKRAGINNPPVSWEDVIDAVAKLTVRSKEGSIITSGIALGTASNVDHFSDIYGLFLIQNGGNITQLDQPEAAGALESYRKFSEPPDNFWSEELPSSVTAFVQEKVAMIIAPSWQILTIKNANPEIDLKVVPVPVIPGSKQVSVASYWVEGVSRYSQNQIEAWKFLKFLSEKESLSKLYELQAKTRLFGEPYSRKDLGPLLEENPYLGAVIKQAEFFVSVPTVSKTFDNGLNDNIIKYIENAINATSQGVSYESALSTAQLGVEQVLSRYK